MSGNGGGGSGGSDPWAWLGLLKWTLTHHDGTQPSNLTPMSDEDKAFLEKVMKEGIIDENERMKFILQEFSKMMEFYQSLETGGGTVPKAPLSIDALDDLLLELRDIVEQIDYARAFVSLKGLTFLFGAITQSSGIPESTRNQCLGIVVTLAQNNPPVQNELLEMGSIKTLSLLFLKDECSITTRTAIMQAISAIVRSYDIAEGVFEQLPQSPLLVVKGLDPNPVTSSERLRSKTLFFLKAFLTSDTSSPTRVNIFVDAIDMVTNSQYLNDSSSNEIRENSVSLLEQLLQRQFAVNIVLRKKDLLVALGVQRIALLRVQTGEEAVTSRVELERWESFLALLARTQSEDEAKTQYNLPVG